MTISSQLAKQLRDLYFGGNWTSSSLQQHLAGVTWEQATAKVDSLNTIAKLVYHINYYIAAVTRVLQGGGLEASDQFSFDHPPVESKEDWDHMVERSFAEASRFADLVEQLPPESLNGPFLDGKYGTVYRNIAGIIEHGHYHLGQIVLIKKMLPAP